MFSIALENYNCKIKITSTKVGVDKGTVTGLKIKRKESGDTSWVTLTTKSITTINDFNYVFIDKYTRSRRTYVYSFVSMSGTTEGVATEHTIECNFDSVYIFDGSDEYMISLNLDYDVDPNVKYTIQDLLQVKYPRFIQNGISDYEGGTIEGLLLNTDAKGNPVATGSYKLKRAFMDYLKNGAKKYIKTPRGDAWMTFIKPDVKINKSEHEDACTVRFSFVEASDPPES